jgi:hypothetical protein
MTNQRFEEMKEVVISVSGNKLVFVELEHYQCFPHEEDKQRFLQLVVRCAKTTIDEALDFATEMINRSVDGWYDGQIEDEIKADERFIKRYGTCFLDQLLV